MGFLGGFKDKDSWGRDRGVGEGRDTRGDKGEGIILGGFFWTGGGSEGFGGGGSREDGRSWGLACFW